MPDSSRDFSEPAAHDMYTHGNGQICILVDGTWFVPLDAGGEGYLCEMEHGPEPRDERALGWERAHTTMCPRINCRVHRNPWQRTRGTT
jgi:hypothetical protein